MMAAAEALLDSDVVVSLVAESHPRHAASLKLMSQGEPRRFAVAAHSYAEAYTTLTRRGPRAGYCWAARPAWQTLESVAAATILLGLSPGQTLSAIRSYAEAGNIGPRLYDRLIGEVAVLHDVPRIITWNVAHFRDLFPTLEILSPGEATQP